MIEGVVVKALDRHYDQRGFFEEIFRCTEPIFDEGFGQWSCTKMYQGVSKAFHIHSIQTDLWFVPTGIIKAVLIDLRVPGFSLRDWVNLQYYPVKQERIMEVMMGEDYPCVLKIPPGVAHGLQVIQGPVYMTYITSHTYNPDDEGRIPYDALGYDWFKKDIK